MFSTKVIYAALILCELYNKKEQMTAVEFKKWMCDEFEMRKSTFDPIFRRLQQAKYIGEYKYLTLCRDLKQTTLYDLYLLFHLGTPMGEVFAGRSALKICGTGTRYKKIVAKEERLSTTIRQRMMATRISTLITKSRKPKEPAPACRETRTRIQIW